MDEPERFAACFLDRFGGICNVLYYRLSDLDQIKTCVIDDAETHKITYYNRIIITPVGLYDEDNALALWENGEWQTW